MNVSEESKNWARSRFIYRRCRFTGENYWHHGGVNHTYLFVSKPVACFIKRKMTAFEPFNETFDNFKKAWQAYAHENYSK